MILVGPGTGIAPYRSFWQQRQHDRGNALADGQSQDVGPGDVLLVFGCRHSKLDDLYKEEKLTAKEEGALTGIIVAAGSELHIAAEAAKELGPGTRVVSMPCVEAFERQDAAYQAEVLPA